MLKSALRLYAYITKTPQRKCYLAMYVKYDPSPCRLISPLKKLRTVCAILRKRNVKTLIVSRNTKSKH